MSYVITLPETNLESDLIFNMIWCLKVCKVNVSNTNQTFLLTWTLILEMCYFWRKNSNVSSKLYWNTTFFLKEYLAIVNIISVYFPFPIKVRFWWPSITALPNTASVTPSLNGLKLPPPHLPSTIHVKP